MTVCFIGHRKVQKTEELVSLLKATVIELIEKGVKTFLFGSKSEFDELAWEVVTELKVKYPFIKRVYVRAAFQHVNEFYVKYLLKLYEETYFPPKIENAGKFSYVERNFEMIDNSAYCVFYYDESYVPKEETKKRDILRPTRSKSGTRVAYNYAIKNNKKIINVFR